MELNPILVEKILRLVLASKNGVAAISAKQLDVDFKTFAAQLDAMLSNKLIDTADDIPFAKTISSDETEVRVSITTKGKGCFEPTSIDLARQRMAQGPE